VFGTHSGHTRNVRATDRNIQNETSAVRLRTLRSVLWSFHQPDAFALVAAAVWTAPARSFEFYKELWRIKLLAGKVPVYVVLPKKLTELRYVILNVLWRRTKDYAMKI
jgi:hypothetical protein